MKVRAGGVRAGDRLVLRGGGGVTGEVRWVRWPTHDGQGRTESYEEAEDGRSVRRTVAVTGWVHVVVSGGGGAVTLRPRWDDEVEVL